MYTRKNQRNLTRREKRRFVDALLEHKRSGRYDEYVTMHGRFFSTDIGDGLRVAHMTPSFLPWHRKFLLEFERELQEIDPKVSLPYWDWTKDDTADSSLWQDDLLGGNGRNGDLQVMTGPFAYSSGNWTINEGVTDAPYLTRNFGRPTDPVSLPSRKELEWAIDDPTYDVAPWDSTVQTGFRNKFEGWTRSEKEGFHNHNRVHLWVGGHMTGGTSPNDPVFWLHHAFIDLVWSRWQERHPRGTYEPKRRLPEDDPQHGKVVSLTEPMPPWDVSPAELRNHRRSYRYE